MHLVYIDMSAGQDSEFGRVLRKFYYGGKHNDLIAVAPGRSGFPHDGGFHSMRIAGVSVDCTTFLQLFVERFPEVKESIDFIQEQIALGEKRIILRTKAELTQFHCEPQVCIEPTIVQVH